jgi:hypothetical protein
MLKRDITYETYDEPPKTVTETFYFNLTRMDVFEFEADKGGLEDWFKKVVANEDTRAVFKQFKEFILSAAGERSEDGKRFDKDEETKKKFKNHAAFDQLAYELMQDPEKFDEFLTGCLSSTVQKEIAAAQAKQATSVAPVPPSPPVPPAV